jgi:hypothetical protein
MTVQHLASDYQVDIRAVSRSYLDALGARGTTIGLKLELSVLIVNGIRIHTLVRWAFDGKMYVPHLKIICAGKE